ncbi:50S ribosomal protein L21 [Candidatus Mesenet endosymbiont of Agriotes lineatus]|uniref:50S ribosomal protein L21 n=1 Tax=Candidatus Mesenet endosymbiont of Agriotes lineatus TaxID=3077948 RepID=UPI0030D5B133
MFAVIETGGKQYTVKEGDVIKVEKLKADQGAEVLINNVHFVNDQSSPVFSSINAVVKAQVLEQCRGEKVIIFKKRRRKHYRRKKGHRQYLTVLRITGIDIKE